MEIDYGYLRGHFILRVDDSNWSFFNMTDRHVDFDNEPDCVKCNLPPTPEGYDACLGFIPGAVAACCGHGVKGLGYVLLEDGSRIQKIDE